MIAFVALIVAVIVPAGAIQVPDTIPERTRPCTACHGKEGRATREGYFPRIAGKPAGYLYNQLVNFREGRRANPAMMARIAKTRSVRGARETGAASITITPIPIRTAATMQSPIGVSA